MAERLVVLCRVAFPYKVYETNYLKNASVSYTSYSLELSFNKVYVNYPFGKGMPVGSCGNAVGGPLTDAGPSPIGLIVEDLNEENLRRASGFTATVEKIYDSKTKEFEYRFPSLLTPLWKQNGRLFQLQLMKDRNNSHVFRLDYNHPNAVKIIPE